jgi:hypothetical protein
MTMRTLSMMAVLMLAFAATAPAADVSGKWVGKLEGPMGSIEITFNFEVKGTELAGTVSDPMGGENKIQEGKINGDELAFIVMAGGGEFKLTYKGKMAGDDLKLTMSFGGGDMPPMELTAKRVK